MFSPIKLKYQQKNAKLRYSNISRQILITGYYKTAKTPKYFMKNSQIWWPIQFTVFSERIGNERSENKRIAVKIKKKYPYNPDKNRKSNRGRYYESNNPNKGKKNDIIPKITKITGRGLTKSKKIVYWETNICFAYGKKGHKLFECPNKTKIIKILDFKNNHNINNEQKLSGKK
ncbi:uncharacterized protein PpBr36_11063 [Pyricularia pennisetigena]|uniref:uncharacterized protein n=1 Tax=Pyricularia pennisetigena TaxID=1578925 RepID=UPI0011522069|nr:uncharacterized protein PpBr36_11063 [Pyricularia pennisetigena]TLS20638.1 hypothetical protein PpBr36_11063 [Pyricularia pennisetigena]